jgi:hypothetical protein
VLTDGQRNALFIDVHRAIERAADETAAVLTGQAAAAEPAYPPNGGFTAEEKAALAALPVRPELASAIRKLVAGASAGPLFTLLSLIDGVADPSTIEGPWPSFHLAQTTDQEFEHLMLHDVFFDSYWLWRDRRPDPGWTLDTSTWEPGDGSAGG